MENKDIEFISDIFTKYPLSRAKDWIASNYRPEEVFNIDKLAKWARNAGYALISTCENCSNEECPRCGESGCSKYKPEL